MYTSSGANGRDMAVVVAGGEDGDEAAELKPRDPFVPDVPVVEVVDEKAHCLPRSIALPARLPPLATRCAVLYRQRNRRVVKLQSCYLYELEEKKLSRRNASGLKGSRVHLWKNCYSFEPKWKVVVGRNDTRLKVKGRIPPYKRQFPQQKLLMSSVSSSSKGFYFFGCPHSHVLELARTHDLVSKG